MSRRAEAVASVDRKLFLVGTLPEIGGIEGRTRDGRPTLTLSYSKDHPNGSGSVVFRGNVAEAASIFNRLRTGETISRGDLSTDERPIDERTVSMYARAFNEGLIQAGRRVSLESMDGEYFLVPEDRSKRKDSDEAPRPKGVLEFAITTPDRSITLDGEEAEIFDEVRRAEADDILIQVSSRKRGLLQSALRRKETGIDFIVNVEPQIGLYIPRETRVEERYVIDLDNSQMNIQTPQGEIGPRSKQSGVFIDDTTASIIATAKQNGMFL